MVETTTPYSLRYPIDEESITPSRIEFKVERIVPTVSASVDNTLTADPSGDLPSTETGDPEQSSVDPETSSVTVEARTDVDDVGSISLYLPPEIQFQDGVDFGEVSFNSIAGRAGLSAVERGGGSFSTGGLLENFERTANSLLDGLRGQSVGDIARLVATRVALNAGEEVSGITSIATQTSLNPNKRVLFKSVNLRAFQFSFTLIPTSREEAEAIKAIVKQFRTELYPEEIAVEGIPFGYKFPNRFIISFFHGENQIAYKLQPAYLTDITTSFNGGGRGFFEDGNFTETTITLSFKEYKTLKKQDIADGY